MSKIAATGKAQAKGGATTGVPCWKSGVQTDLGWRHRCRILPAAQSLGGWPGVGGGLSRFKEYI